MARPVLLKNVNYEMKDDKHCDDYLSFCEGEALCTARNTLGFIQVWANKEN